MGYGNMNEAGDDRASMAVPIAGLFVSLFLFVTIHCRMGVGAPVWARAVMYLVALLLTSVYVANIVLHIREWRDRKKGHR